MDASARYNEASVKTAADLRTIAHSALIRDLSRLTLPEIDAAIDLIARLVPAGNIPGMILSGLAHMAGRRPPPETMRRDIRLLFQGVEQVLDGAIYAAFFAGPAAVIWGYQQLLKLAGKDVDEAFPEGTWQFYVGYALREDSARHTNETHGFDTRLTEHEIRLDPVDRITAWVMAAIHCLHQYDDLLANEWRERVYTRLLVEVTADLPDAARYSRLYQEWARQRPLSRAADTSPSHDYPAYRRHKFDRFLEQARADLPMEMRRRWADRVRVAEEAELPLYRRQMTILAYLEPGPYGETRVPIPLERAQVGMIHQGCYFLIPACVEGTRHPSDVSSIRAQIANVVAYGTDTSSDRLVQLAQVQRSSWPELGKQLSGSLTEELAALNFAPILFNSDRRPGHLPLAELRLAERGIGSHALTIFDTGETFLFDQSHIFFDGAWGAALADILTNEALSWANYLQGLPPADARGKRPFGLCFTFQASERALIDQAPTVVPEASAESSAVNLKAVLALRKLFKQRSDLLQLTVNDLLILYRAIHALTNRPNPDLVDAIEPLLQQAALQEAAKAALEVLGNTNQVNPAILIPIDASQNSPRDRLYPISFEVPLAELDLLSLHERLLIELDAHEQAEEDRPAWSAQFDQLQREYLAALAGFGAVLRKAKDVGMMGESTSAAAIKLLAHIPAPLQRLLDAIPGRFDVLNDVIKGREVFSNLGAVARASTLTRFITAKDDNDKKTLAWGVLTDADGTMHITLRDFRPYVGLLERVGRKDIARRIVQDYVNSYAHGLNGFVSDLQRITLASRGTSTRPEKGRERLA